MNRLLIVISGIFLLVLGILWPSVDREALKEDLGLTQRPPQSQTYLHRQDLYQSLVQTPHSIIFLGDSLTEGGRWSEMFQDPRFINRGIGGDTTQGILNRLDSIIVLQPEIVFLMIGINDLIRDHSPKIVLKNYQMIVEQFKNSSSALLVIQSLLPINNRIRWRCELEKIVQVNEGLQALAQDLGCPYLDLFDFFADTGGQLKADLTFDGLHLNGLGYQIWREQLQSFLQSFHE